MKTKYRVIPFKQKKICNFRSKYYNHSVQVYITNNVLLNIDKHIRKQPALSHHQVQVALLSEEVLYTALSI